MTDYLAAETRRIAELEKQAAALLDVFTHREYSRVDPPVLQPADVFLDRSGEEIRRRTFLLTDAAGRELCLRPELTIPVCRLHLERGGTFPARLCYHGPAFRMRGSDRRLFCIACDVRHACYLLCRQVLGGQDIHHSEAGNMQVNCAG